MLSVKWVVRYGLKGHKGETGDEGDRVKMGDTKDKGSQRDMGTDGDGRERKVIRYLKVKRDEGNKGKDGDKWVKGDSGERQRKVILVRRDPKKTLERKKMRETKKIMFH